MAIAVPVGLVMGAGLGWLAVVAQIAGPSPWLGGLVFAAGLSVPSTALVFVLIVDRETMQGAEARPEESIEASWHYRAASGAFMDLVALLGVAALVTSFVPVDLPVQVVLGGALLLAMAAFGVRFLVARLRG